MTEPRRKTVPSETIDFMDTRCTARRAADHGRRFNHRTITWRLAGSQLAIGGWRLAVGKREGIRGARPPGSRATLENVLHAELTLRARLPEIRLAVARVEGVRAGR